MLNIQNKNRLEFVVRISLVFVCLYGFLIGVKGLETAIKLMGGEFTKSLLTLSTHPFVSLLAGMMGTVLIQSSSVTTSLIVGLVSAGALNLDGAIPMIMGANLGTSVTNTLVAFGHVKDREHFQRAFAGGCVHDMFNILSVAVLLPLELATHFLRDLSIWTSNFLYGSIEGGKISGPLKSSLKSIVAKIIETIQFLSQDQFFVSSFLLCLSAGIIFLALFLIVKDMKVLVTKYRGDIIDTFLNSNPFLAIIFGIGLTMSVQSSSITTSLLVPLAGSGLLSIESIFPITIGANIGTTTTALLAAFAGNIAGLSIALVHFFFNIFGTLIWYPLPFMRKIPLALAKKLGESVVRSRRNALVYVSVVFFLLPGLAIFLSSM